MYSYSTKSIGEINKRDIFKLAKMKDSENYEFELAKLLELKKTKLFNTDLFDFSISDKSLENNFLFMKNKSKDQYITIEA